MRRERKMHDTGASTSNTTKPIVHEGDASAPSTSKMPLLEGQLDPDPLRFAFERAAKSIRTAPLAEEVIDQVQFLMQQSITSLQSTSVDFNAVIADLRSKLDELAAVSKLKSIRKEAERSLDDFLNMSDSLFTKDISDAYMESRDLDRFTTDNIIANYLYRQNLYEAGNLFIRQAGIPEASTLKSQYKEMHEILDAMRAWNLRPAINWATRNRNGLLRHGLHIEYRIHIQQYLEMLKSPCSKLEALNYVQTYISPTFGTFYPKEIKKLLGCIVWIDQIEESPYVEFLSQFNFDKLANDFTEQFLSQIGESTLCPLTTTIDAGAKNLHLMLTFRNIINDKDMWGAITHLPFRHFEVDQKYNFHPCFVCPECHELDWVLNPPIRLPCQHVFCWWTVARWSECGLCWFKCIFCQCDANYSQCMMLNI